jgi:hypothetical protein
MVDINFDANSIEYIPIQVTSNIFLRIGAGIYSSVAGALKELVSNSFDADATTVVISMNYPKFDEIKVFDNGLGMSPDRFKLAMRNIGSSLKGTLEPDRKSKKYKRPIIGHLGIGLMALSQICDEAIVESQEAGSTEKFIAKLDFSDFKNRASRQDLYAQLEVFQNKYGGEQAIKLLLKNEKDPEKIAEFTAALELSKQASDTLKKIKPAKDDSVEGEHLGYCAIYPSVKAVEGEQGTTITLRLIDDGVRKLLQDVDRPPDALPLHLRDKKLGWKEFQHEVNLWSWEELCDRLRLGTSSLSYQSLPKYHQFLWELSIMSPVQYFQQGPVLNKPEILKSKKRELDKYNFSLIVDNRQLLKPILLPSGPLGVDVKKLKMGHDYFVETFELDEKVANERIKCSAYIFWQRKQVIPSVLRGIQIYIRNVGIGLYDSGLMNFSTVNPTSRAGQMSAEIYVEEGLERALNVDRNSFRETDAHYLALQQKLWTIIGSGSVGDGIIGKSVKAYYVRKNQSDDEKYELHVNDMKHLVHDIGKGDLEISFSKRGTQEPFSYTNGKITVYENSPRWPKSRADRLEVQRILIAVKAAIESGKSRDEILKILEDLLLRR